MLELLMLLLVLLQKGLDSHAGAQQLRAGRSDDQGMPRGHRRAQQIFFISSGSDASDADVELQGAAFGGS
eukprot:10475255-Alexandrium_andersonii.AAC.1